MAHSDITPILEELAAGRIDAAEASRRIDALRVPTGSQAPPPQEASAEWPLRPGADGVQDPPKRRRAPGTNGVDRVSVHAVGRRVRIVGDPSVSAAAAEGPHVLRRNGSVLEVSSDGELGPNLDGFSLLRPPRSLDDLRALGLGKELFLRINPSIVLDVEVTAGTLHIENVPYLGKVRVTAGSANLEGLSEASDVLVQAGQATLSGTFRSGRSRVRCESGSLVLKLGEESNVVVRGETQLGKIAWTPAQPAAVDEVVVGDGAARLDVGVIMGHAQIRIGETTGEDVRGPRDDGDDR